MKQKEIIAIADAHIKARNAGNFTHPRTVKFTSKKELFEAFKRGETVETALDEIEIRFCTITSIMLAGVLGHTSQKYRTNVRKAFKKLIAHLEATTPESVPQ
jgi:hypothetical protein